jgi:hypothetical protein
MLFLSSINNPVTPFSVCQATIPVQWSALILDRAKYWHEQAVFVK